MARIVVRERPVREAVDSLEWGAGYLFHSFGPATC